MKIPKITQEEIGIIKRAQAGDMSAFNKLFNKYKTFVEKILFSYIHDDDESKDIANIVFLKAYDKLSTFTDYSSFGGWLRIITNRTAIDYLRSRALHKLTLEDQDSHLNIHEESGNNENDLINHMTYEKIMSEIKKLPEQKRKINELFYVNNLTVVQISEILHVPVGTVKSVLFRTRNKLKQQFKK